MEIIKRNKGFIALVAGIMLFRSSFADQYVVPSGSMEPTIQIGDRILTNKMAYDLQIPFTQISLARMGDPERGDIVVFENPESGIVMVKRLVGLPGDKISFADGKLAINGESVNVSELEEKHGMHTIETKRTWHRVDRSQGTFTVPVGSYFMLGDNRENSLDSRYWGFVPRKLLLGKALRVTFSANIFQKNPNVALHRFGKNLY